MKLKIPQTQLESILAIASHAIPTKPTHPILSSFVLHGNSETQKLTVTAFNLSLGIRAQCDCIVESEGTIALPARLLEEVVAHLPKSDITLEVNDSVAILTHSTGKCQLQTANPEDFPALPEVSGTPVTLSVAKLQQALKATLFAASRDEIKQVIAGVYFKFGDANWEAAATDGHRLAIASDSIESNNTAALGSVEATIPYQTLAHLERILDRVPNNCTINVSNGIAVFELQNVRLTSRLLEGQYPNYPSLVPTQFQYCFKIDKKALDSALKRTSIVASQKDKVVKMTFDAARQCATISAQSPDVGDAVEALAIEIENAVSDNLEIGFNIKYLLDAIKVIASEQVLIEANKPERPVIVKPLGSSINQMVMVMPVQLIATARSAPRMQENSEPPADAPTQTPTTEAPVAQNDNLTPQKQPESLKSKTGKKKLQAA
ncbi:MAG: Beta sliding clamp [Chroococcidiopsis sp. SAG 2025]|uniref:DNA polymerase III subunit beta n=1 Tax=Chroococcidiopsis sp. SAG 2025 TaxID=171389 RepID=UPI0029372356|nr:DNA polymerase III subunit beta [Chroococcidiopsis sp. SAG 2025]MDV2994863.1 Beta sliding clamp [Chroococcidiopsis sp. SAG 2025]